MIKTYKDSILGEIPRNWKVIKLKSKCEKLNVGFVGTCEKFYCKKEEGVLMLRTGNLSNGKIKYSNLKYVTREFHDKNIKSQIFKDDLLVARHGSSGQAVLVPDNFEESNCLNIIVIRPEESLNSKFLKFQFNSSIVKKQVLRKTAGSTQGVVNTKEIASLDILVPPLPEQQKIADILSTVDAKIEIIDQQITETQELKKGLMQRLLTKGIGHTEFKDSPLGEIPVDWEVVKLGDIGEFKNGINKGKEDFGHGFPMVNLNDVFGVSFVKNKNLGLVNSTPNERIDYALKQGDVLFIRSSVKPSGVGLTAVIIEALKDTVYSGFIIRFRDNGVLDVNYKKYCFYDTHFRNRLLAKSSISANTNINQKSLNSLPISVPPIPEQQQIAEILSSVDNKLEVLSEKKATYQELKKGLMQQLLTGKVRVKV